MLEVSESAMEEERKSILKAPDLNPEDLQGMISELSDKMEEDRRVSEEMEVTICSQRKRISNLKREYQLLKALNESIDGDIKEKEKERSEMSCFLSGSQVADLINRERAKLLKQQQALQEQLEEYRLALDSCCQDLEKRWMDVEHLEDSIKEFLTMIQELTTRNNDLEIQLEKAVVSGGPHADQPLSKEEEVGQLPHTYVEFSDVDEVEDEKEQEPSVDADVQTKSWWRRQAERLWKVVKHMGTFCLGIMRCQGMRSCIRQATRSNQVHPV